MKILMLGDIRPAHLKRWRDYFSDTGHEVLVASLESDPEDTDYIRIEMSVPIRPFKYYMAKGQVKKIIADFKPDIVNAHFATNYGMLAVATGFSPVAVSLWGSDVLISPGKSPLHRARVRWVLRNCQLVTSDSQYMSGVASEMSGADVNVITQPMGVPRDIINELEGTSIRRPELTTIISCRRLEPLYNVSLLIDALFLMGINQKKLQCLISGDGSQRGELESRVKKKGVRNVAFFGWLKGEEYLRFLATGDIYVSCARSDSTSVTLLESMAAGLFPVVADIPGNREWIADGDNGLLFAPGDVDALKDALQQAIESPELRQRAVGINRGLVRERGLWEDNMAEIERAFQELVETT
jgi:glycosyltransferase involved in cell wall biosynthesis